MRKIREIASIALILVVCSIIIGLQKPEEKAKAENTGYTLQDSVFFAILHGKQFQSEAILRSRGR